MSEVLRTRSSPLVAIVHRRLSRSRSARASPQGGGRGGRPAAAAIVPLPKRLRDDRPLRRRIDERRARRTCRVLAAVPAVVRRHAKRRWIHAAARHGDRRQRADAWGSRSARGCGRSSRFGRPRRDALHRARSPTARGASRPTCGAPTAATPCWRRTTACSRRARRAGRPLRGAARDDCLACHEGAAVPVLGFSRAAALARPRSARAARRPPRRGDVDLRGLVARGLLRGLPPSAARRAAAHRRARRRPNAPRSATCTATAATATTRRARSTGLDLVLAQRADRGDTAPQRDARDRLLGAREPLPAAGRASAQRIAAGAPASSVLAAAHAIRQPLARMPPLGAQLVDAEGSR